MNHCLLEVEVLEAPQVRYSQGNQSAIAEMLVSLEGLRPDDPPGRLKVVGWGNLAEELPARVQIGQRLLIEGRLRMNTVTRQDGVKEKRAEFTLLRLHPVGQASPAAAAAPPAAARPQAGSAAMSQPAAPAAPAVSKSAVAPEVLAWNTSPLVPELGDDDIPF